MVRIDADDDDLYGTTILHEQKAVRFLLEDGSGRALVEPEGAEPADGPGSDLMKRRAELERKEGFQSASKEHRVALRGLGFLRERGDRIPRSWRRRVLEGRAELLFREEIVEIGETLCVAGAGVREGDPEGAPGEGYRTAAPTRLRFTSSPQLRLLITDDPSKQ